MPSFSAASWLKLLATILSSDVADSIRELIGLAGRLRYAPGLYEVLEHDVHLTLKDRQGQRAAYEKHQRVRFLQDHVIAFQDTAWGDGDIFVNYRCSPGKAVDRYREGHRHRVLISLRETKQRGDTEEFYISRDIHQGFLTNHEYLHTEIYHRTHRLQMRVTFPHSHPPKAAWLTEANTNRTADLDSNAIQKLPDGRKQIVWRKARPRLHEGYILAWDW